MLAQIRGPGMGDDSIGTRAMNFKPSSKAPGGMIYAANSVADEFSDWGDAAQEGSEAAALQEELASASAVQESQDCL